MAWLVASYLYLAGGLSTAMLLHEILPRPIQAARAAVAVLLWPLFLGAIGVIAFRSRRA